MNSQSPHELQVKEAMMRAIAILSLSGVVLAAGGAVVVIGLSVAHAQAPSGPVAVSRPLDTTRQPAPPLYCL